MHLCVAQVVSDGAAAVRALQRDDACDEVDELGEERERGSGVDGSFRVPKQHDAPPSTSWRITPILCKLEDLVAQPRRVDAHGLVRVDS